MTGNFWATRDRTIPLLKALMFGINAVGAQGSGCMFTLCNPPLKMGVLLHKMASVCKQALMTVCIQAVWRVGIFAACINSFCVTDKAFGKAL